MIMRNLIARISRFIHRISGKYSQLDVDKTASGLAQCLVAAPPTKEQKEEKYRQQLLRGVKGKDKNQVIDHIKKLSTENDPLENIDISLEDSTKKINININVDDVRHTIKEIREEISAEKDTQRAEDIIRGMGKWPNSINRDARRKK